MPRTGGCVLLIVVALHAVAVVTAQETGPETITVELEAIRLAAVTPRDRHSLWLHSPWSQGVFDSVLWSTLRWNLEAHRGT